VSEIRDPILRAAFLRAYRAWLARCEQLSLFEERE
jgi:hypothetical protein